MNDEDKKTPEEVADAELDDATGGIRLSTTKRIRRTFDGGFGRTPTAASSIDNIGDVGQTDTVVADISIKTSKR